MSKGRSIEHSRNVRFAQFARVSVAVGFPKQQVPRRVGQMHAFGTRHGPIWKGSSHASFGRSTSAHFTTVSCPFIRPSIFLVRSCRFRLSPFGVSPHLRPRHFEGQPGCPNLGRIFSERAWTVCRPIPIRVCSRRVDGIPVLRLRTSRSLGRKVDQAMAFVQGASIQCIAQSMHMEEVSSAAEEELATDVEYRMREVLQVRAKEKTRPCTKTSSGTRADASWDGTRWEMQEALKFMRHARRCTLTTSDVNRALQLLNVEVRTSKKEEKTASRTKHDDGKTETGS